MDKRKITKFALSTIGGMAAGTVTALLIKQNIDPVKTSQKVATAIGGFVIGSYVQDKISDYIDGYCDSIFESIDKIKGNANEPLEDISIEDDKDDEGQDS